MSELTLKKRILKVTLEEGVFEMRFPTYKQITDFRTIATSDELKDSDLIDLLNTLGLPKDVAINQEESTLTTILETLTDKKKR